MAAWRYEISLLVLKNISIVRYFSTLEEKFLISARRRNILYLLWPIAVSSKQYDFAQTRLKRLVVFFCSPFYVGGSSRIKMKLMFYDVL